MPYEAVADDGHAVVLAKLHETVGVVPEIDVLLRMNLGAFHHIFGHDCVEMVLDHSRAFGIGFLRLIVVDGYSHTEFVAKYLFERSVGDGGH